MRKAMIQIPQKRFEELIKLEERVNVAVETAMNEEYASVTDILFIFGTAVLLGLLIAAGAVVLLDHTMIQSLGLKCRYLYPEVLVEILCSYALILGALQIPVRVALYKIRTIDAMDDDFDFILVNYSIIRLCESTVNGKNL